MKKSMFYLALALILGSCAPPVTNPFPNDFKNSKTAKHKRIKATRIFAIVPDKYEYLEDSGRYQLSEDQFIIFTEFVNSFAKQKVQCYKNQRVKKQFGYDKTFYDEFKFNSYEAIFVEDQIKNEVNLALWFGDSKFTAIISAQTSSDSPENRNELIEIMKSIYYDNNRSLDEGEFDYFSYDNSITGFKHAMTGAGMILYNEKGRVNLHKLDDNNIVFRTLTGFTEEELIIQSGYMLRDTANSEGSITFENFEKTNIGNYIALLNEIHTTMKYERILEYVAVLSKGDKSVLFSGNGSYRTLDKSLLSHDLDSINLADLRDKFVRTVASIKIK